MKIFQVYHGLCYYDATPVHPTIESTVGRYSPDIVFVEAPDYVFEGWGYDDTKVGDNRFIQPEPPEGWRYDPKSGQFIEIDPKPIETPATLTERVTTLEAENTTLKSQLKVSVENAQFLENCIVELADRIYN